MLLSFLEIEYLDRQVTLDEWSQGNIPTPFARMPVYTEGVLVIPEAHAIMNHLGRAHGLMGETEAQRVRCDVTIEAWRDYGNRVANAFGALSTSEDERKRFVKEEQPRLLADLEAFYRTNNSVSGYWAGDTITIADFTAFHLVDGLRGQFPSLFARFAGLGEFHTQFAELPKIKRYLDSPHRPAALFYGPAGKIYPKDA